MKQPIFVGRTKATPTHPLNIYKCVSLKIKSFFLHYIGTKRGSLFKMFPRASNGYFSSSLQRAFLVLWFINVALIFSTKIFPDNHGIMMPFRGIVVENSKYYHFIKRCILSREDAIQNKIFISLLLFSHTCKEYE